MHIYAIQCDWQSDVIDVKDESDEIDEKDGRGSDAAPTLRSEKLSHGDDETLSKCWECSSQTTYYIQDYR